VNILSLIEKKNKFTLDFHLYEEISAARKVVDHYENLRFQNVKVSFRVIIRMFMRLTRYFVRTLSNNKNR
jgi:hypothetical protein